MSKTMPVNSFTNENRSRSFAMLSHSPFDLVVIGEEHSAAYIALEATLRGLKTAVFAITDFNAADIPPVEILSDYVKYPWQHRQLTSLWQNAGHLFYPVRCIRCDLDATTSNSVKTKIRLFRHDFVSRFARPLRHRAAKCSDLELSLSNDYLQRSLIYTTYKSDNYRITIEAFKKAAENGTCVLNYVDVSGFKCENGSVVGLEIKDKHTDVSYAVDAKYVVNASQIRFNQILTLANNDFLLNSVDKKYSLFLISKDKLPLNNPIVIQPNKNLSLKLIPHFSTIFAYSSSNSNNEDLLDVDSFVGILNRVFVDIHLKSSDVVCEQFLVRNYELPRKVKKNIRTVAFKIFETDMGLICSLDFDLMNVHRNAKKIVDYIFENRLGRKHHKSTPSSATATTTRLAGADWENVPSMHFLIDLNDKKYDEAKQVRIPVNDFKRLFYQYGTNVDIITDKAYELMPQSTTSEEAWMKAEYWYCLQNEMIICMGDFFSRRNELHFICREKKYEYEKAISAFD